MPSNVGYHRECYMCFTNKDKFEMAQTYLLTYLVLLHFRARRANRGNQVSPSGSTVG